MVCKCAMKLKTFHLINDIDIINLTIFSAPIDMDVKSMITAMANIKIQYLMFHFKTFVPSKL